MSRSYAQQDLTIKLNPSWLSFKFMRMFFTSLFVCMTLLFLMPETLQAKQSSLNIEQVKSEFYPDGNKMTRIRDITALNNGSMTTVDIYLSIKSSIVMSLEQEQMLLNGIPLTFVYDVRLEEKRFFGGNDYAKEIRYLLYYHGLSKQFVVRGLTTQKQYSYPTLSLALLFISTPPAIEFEVKDEQGFHLDRYEGRAKLWLDIEALPTPLRIPAYLSSNWWLNSSWFKWELSL